MVEWVVWAAVWWPCGVTRERRRGRRWGWTTYPSVIYHVSGWNINIGMACASGPFPGITIVHGRAHRVTRTTVVCTCARVSLDHDAHARAHTYKPIGITNGTEDSYRSQQESTPGVLYLSADLNLATEKEANFRFIFSFLFPLQPRRPLPPPRLSFVHLFPLRLLPRLASCFFGSLRGDVTALLSADSSSPRGHVTTL